MMFEAFDISASALKAQRLRMTVISNNLANANTTRAADGSLRPYRRKQVIFSQGAAGITGDPEMGVSFAGVLEDATPFRRVYRPGHPDAITAEMVDARNELTIEDVGYVMMPNVRMPIEMVDMMEAHRAYEANVTAMTVSKALGQALLELLA